MKSLALRSRIKPPHLGFVSQVVIVLLVITLMGAMAIEPARQLLEQRELVAGMRKDLQEVERSNDNLKERIHRLNDADFIEQRAREQIGLVRPGEIPFVVMPSSASHKKDRHEARTKSKKDRVPKAPAVEPAPPRDEPGFIEGLLDFIAL